MLHSRKFQKANKQRNTPYTPVYTSFTPFIHMGQKSLPDLISHYLVSIYREDIVSGTHGCR